MPSTQTAPSRGPGTPTSPRARSSASISSASATPAATTARARPRCTRWPSSPSPRGRRASSNGSRTSSSPPTRALPTTRLTTLSASLRPTLSAAPKTSEPSTPTPSSSRRRRTASRTRRTAPPSKPSAARPRSSTSSVPLAFTCRWRSFSTRSKSPCRHTSLRPSPNSEEHTLASRGRLMTDRIDELGHRFRRWAGQEKLRCFRGESHWRAATRCTRRTASVHVKHYRTE
mmetsp:Transcript_5323/g.19316  ORF Transcript_5323/g.19316 Transcript_5323/m.19316 type:complete len:230 (-) Transcript_5323:52-741(-)